MPRKYDRTIRYYDSWFGDLLDPNKQFTPAECWSVILAIRDCQLKGSLEPLDALPISVRRGLSMATLGEQIIRQLERAERRRNGCANGGNTAAANRKDPEKIAAAAMKAEKELKEQRELQQRREEAARKAYLPPAMLERLRKASEGDAAALKFLGMSIEQAKKNYSEWIQRMSNQKQQ